MGRQYGCRRLSRKHGRERARLGVRPESAIVHALVRGRAIVYGLASRGFRRIAIVNRTYARAVALATEFSDVAVAAPWESLSLNFPAVICSSTQAHSA